MKKKEDLYYKFMFTSLKRIIKFGWNNFYRNKGLSFSSTFIMTIAILLIVSLLFFREASQFFISYIQEKVDISVSFNLNIDEEKIFEVKNELLKMEEIRNIEYSSQEEELENFKQKHQDDEILMRSLEEAQLFNPFPLPAVLNIKAWSADQYEQIVESLEDEKYRNIIYYIDYHDRRLIIERVFIATERTNQIVIIISSILILIAILIIFTTTKLAILHQKEEIIVQRLVGASNWFIRSPFLIQGMISGFFAALISFLIPVTAIYFWGQEINALFPKFFWDGDVSAYFFDRIFLIFLVQVVIGVGLGIISSAIAVRKYLKV